MSLLRHISTNLGLHQEAVFIKLLHSQGQGQELTGQTLLAPALCPLFFWASFGALRAGASPPQPSISSPNPFEKLMFLGAMFPECGPYSGWIACKVANPFCPNKDWFLSSSEFEKRIKQHVEFMTPYDFWKHGCEVEARILSLSVVSAISPLRLHLG